jgi:hypothetical protein
MKWTHYVEKWKEFRTVIYIRRTSQLSMHPGKEVLQKKDTHLLRTTPTTTVY